MADMPTEAEPRAQCVECVEMLSQPNIFLFHFFGSFYGFLLLLFFQLFRKMVLGNGPYITKG